VSKKKSLESQANQTKTFIFCILGLFLTTLYFNTQLLDPFNTPKLVVLMITAGWLVGYVISSFKEKNSKLLFWEALVLTFSILFLTTMLVSLFFTEVPLVGIIGETQRRNGFLTYASLIIIFIYLTRFFNYFFINVFFKTVIFLGLILSTYGVAQINGLDFVKWNNPYNSMIATLGNPNFASSLLAIVFLLCLFCIFIKTIKIIYRFTAGIVLIPTLYAVILSQSRQGLIIIGIGIIFYTNAFLLVNKSRVKYLVLLPSIIFVGLSISGMLQIGPLSSLLYKDSVSVRGFYWRAGLEMLKSAPFTGIGIDSYGKYFKQFREVEYPLRYGYEITSSNAHNTIIQLFATGGIFVGICYLTLLVCILICGIKLLRISNFEQNRINLGLLSSWIGFQSQSFISIDNIGISVWGWFLGGSILGLYFSKLKELQPKDTDTLISSRRVKEKISLLQPVVSFLMIIPIIYISALLIRMESLSYDIRVITESGLAESNKPLLLNMAQELENNLLADPFYKFQASTSLVNIGEIQNAYDSIYKLSANDPKNLFYLDWLARYYGETQQIAREIEIRNQIAGLDQWNANNYLRLGSLYKLTGDSKRVDQIKLKILSFAGGSSIAIEAQKVLDQK